MNLTFEWMLEDGQFLKEAELPGRIEEIRQQLAQGGTEGALVLTDPDVPEIHLEDTLGAIAVDFCLEAVGELIAGENTEVEFYSSEGSVGLTVDGNDIVLTLGREVVRYAREEFIPATLDCADRYIAFYRLIYAGDDNRAETARQWEEVAAANRAAWAAANAPKPAV